MSGAEYIAARPGRLRSTLRRKRKRVDEVHAVRFAICSTRQGLESALQDYERVYARSWKTPESAPSFIPHLAKLCADLGVLRLGLLYLDEQPVATQFWIVDGNNAVIYKLAHDHRYDALSVGSLLTEYLCRRAIDEDGVGEIDFGTGDEAYKRDWMTGRRQLVSVHAVNPGTLRGRFLSARWAVRDMLRKLGLRSHTPVDL